MRQTDADRLQVAMIMGTAAHHSRWEPLTPAAEAAALASIARIAGGRCDLLAEVAGILLGSSEGTLDEPRQRQSAQLMIKAGADQDLIPAWIEEGRRRAERGRRIPYTGTGTGNITGGPCAG